MKLIGSLLQPGETMIDVGANIGFTAIEGALAVGPGGCVHAIEPHPAINRCLMENLMLNQLGDRVGVHAVALADPGSAGRTLPFSDDRRDDMNALLEPGACSTLHVPITTLNELFPYLPRCDLLKIDVEGAELAVLRGGASLLARTRQVLVEAGAPNSLRHGSSVEDLLDHLESAGFEVCSADAGLAAFQPVYVEDYRHHVGNWLARRPHD